MKCIGMDVVYTAQIKEEAIDMGRPDIVSLRQEVVQLIGCLRFMGIYFVMLAFAYLVASIVQWNSLSVESFNSLTHKDTWTEDYI